jgi:DNA-binding response OmpR family regulator
MKLEDLTILYAEDESGIRETVTKVLELYVNKVITASNGKEALEYYNLYKPSILLLDICLPLKDGLAVLQQIRQNDLITPVIIMTAHTEQNYLMNAVQLYITKYLVKPFNKDSLLEALSDCIKVITNKTTNTMQLTENIFFNIKNNTILKDDKEIQLNKKETLLLNLLIKNKSNIVSYENIEYHIWDDCDVSKEAFKSLIKDLRKKTSKQLIQNISMLGYKIDF